MIIKVNAKPASRPRVTRWGTYYPKSHVECEKAILKELQTPEKQMTGAVKVSLSFYLKKPAKPTRSYPVPDVDNLAKLVLDSLTKKGYWVDDRQVVDLRVTKAYAEKEPMIEIFIEEI